MMERFKQQESTQSPEKSDEELYFDALEIEKDFLMAFHATNSFRKGRRLEDMTPEEIEQYKVLLDESWLKEQKSMDAWLVLPKDRQDELASMGGRVFDIQAKLTLLKLKNKPEPETGKKKEKDKKKKKMKI